jgi:hypothetical protein
MLATRSAVLLRLSSARSRSRSATAEPALAAASFAATDPPQFLALFRR